MGCGNISIYALRYEWSQTGSGSANTSGGKSAAKTANGARAFVLRTPAPLIGAFHYREASPLLELINSLAPVGALIVFAWGVYQLRRNMQLSFRNPYCETQLKLYLEVTSFTGAIVGTDSEDDWNAARGKFRALMFSRRRKGTRRDDRFRQ